MGNCSGHEVALIELLVALILLALLGCAIIWRAVFLVLKASREALREISELRRGALSAYDAASGPGTTQLP